MLSIGVFYLAIPAHLDPLLRKTSYLAAPSLLDKKKKKKKYTTHSLFSLEKEIMAREITNALSLAKIFAQNGCAEYTKLYLDRVPETEATPQKRIELSRQAHLVASAGALRVAESLPEGSTGRQDWIELAQTEHAAADFLESASKEI